jgi:coniferyl-aldehyde dehydrogenase
MATAARKADESAIVAEMEAILRRQRLAFEAELPVSLETRRDRLDRAIACVLAWKDRLVEALSDDFGHRSREQSLMTDIVASVKPLRHARKNVARWMQAERRPLEAPLGLLGAKARIEWQPKGVVGIISPWNFPVNLTFGPLAGVLAAGNRVMIKPSEYTPATSEVMRQALAAHFDASEVAVFPGGPDVGKAFTGLAFDHLIFTGGTEIGRHVMAAAAKNLVPVTLELGGKSPTIIGRSADMLMATEPVALGKLMNAGQICLAPDYLLVPAEAEHAVIAGLQIATAKLYPTMLSNPDYTSIINRRHRDRLQGLIDDAAEKGAEVVEVNPGNEDFARQNTNKMPLTLIRHPTDEMKVMQEEIFGPVLPIRTYERIEDAIAEVNRRDRPLGLYWFGEDEKEARQVLDRTISGGVTLNDVVFHVSAEDLPFGGIGPSGMGAYHGEDGFRTFSHGKAIYKQPRIDIAGLAGFKPPYGKTTEATLARELKG